jgi:hypothetical protein
MVWALALAPAVALIALLVWGFVALESTTAPNPSASDTATDAPVSPTLEPTLDATSEPSEPTAPATPPIELTITGGPADVVCSGDTTLYFEWSAPNATVVTFAVAGHEHLFELPPAGNSRDDFPYQVQFPCPAETETYRFVAISGAESDEELVTVLSDP